MPVSNINLTTAVPAQPFDIAAELAKQAQYQEIAKQLLGAGMTQPSRTGFMTGEGPLARYVPDYGNAIGRIAQAFAGRSQLSDSQDAVQSLAQMARGRQLNELASMKAPVRDEYVLPEQLPGGGPGDHVPPETLMEPGLRNPSALEMGMRGIEASSPAVLDIAKSLIASHLAIAKDLAVKPGDAARAYAHVTPSSFSNALRTDDFTGAPILARTDLIKPNPIVTSKEPNQISIQSDPATNAARVVGDTTPAVSTVVVPAGTSTAKTAPPLGAPNQQYGGQQEEGNFFIKELAKAAPEHEKFLAQLPQFGQMSTLIDRANLGITSKWRTDFERFLIDAHMSKDEAARVSSTQTLQAMLMPAAIHLSRQESPRASQQVFLKMAEAAGANPTIDPRHAMDVLTNAVAGNLNEILNHNEIDVPRAGKSTMGDSADKYRVDLHKFMPLLTGSPLEKALVLRGPEGAQRYSTGTLDTPRGVEDATGKKVLSDPAGIR